MVYYTHKITRNGHYGSYEMQILVSAFLENYPLTHDKAVFMAVTALGEVSKTNNPNEQENE